MKEKIILATNNAGKIAEFQAICGHAFQLIPQSEFQIPEAEEHACTFIENALLKARHAARLTQLPAIADDSGLCVPALNGAPGIYSARYAGEHANGDAHIQKLLVELNRVEEPSRNAFFYSIIVFVRHESDPTPLIGEGIWHGRILHEPRGHYGFGYDPIVWIDEYQCAVAELKPDIKNQLSHRSQALKQLREKLCRVYPHLQLSN